MDVEFVSRALDRLETDPAYTNNLAPALVKAFRRRMQQLRAAQDERDLYAAKGLHFEKLQGNRQHQRSIRLNDQFRLILELMETEQGRRIRIVAIEDYH
jgi:toxin HigB-1